jgi:hypothetical protein
MESFTRGMNQVSIIKTSAFDQQNQASEREANGIKTTKRLDTRFALNHKLAAPHLNKLQLVR